MFLEGEGNDMEYPCDVCDVMPAMTYTDKSGAVCYDCRAKEQKEEKESCPCNDCTNDNKWFNR